MKRRDFIKAGAVAVATVPLLHPVKTLADAAGTEVTDTHSQLNNTIVSRIMRPQGAADLTGLVAGANERGEKISICGARHAMGGQQFGTRTTLLDLTQMNKVVSLDREEKTIEVEAGMMWPQLIAYLQKEAPELCIIQKQTGADEMTLGGALASNIHGRSLVKKPFISDILSFTIITADGKKLLCSRAENPELFRLAIGGYGLFGIVSSIRIQLASRFKVRRTVDVITTDTLMDAVEKRVKDGYLYGDFQYMTDEKHEDFMRRGIFSCYVPVPEDTALSPASHDLTLDDWQKLYRLAHLDKQRAYQVYRDHYLATNGQVYWSDIHQTGIYLKDFNRQFAKEQGEKAGSSLMLSEVYVPRAKFHDFMEKARAAALDRGMDIVYGTVRFIQKDDESFLPWAKQDYACVIFNLYIVHTPEAIDKAKVDFRTLYDIALDLDGSYYLTYHRWARKDQVEKAYPKFRELLALKKKYDPQEVFESDWYRHYKTIFA